MAAHDPFIRAAKRLELHERSAVPPENVEKHSARLWRLSEQLERCTPTTKHGICRLLEMAASLADEYHSVLGDDVRRTAERIWREGPSDATLDEMRGRYQLVAGLATVATDWDGERCVADLYKARSALEAIVAGQSGNRPS